MKQKSQELIESLSGAFNEAISENINDIIRQMQERADAYSFPVSILLDPQSDGSIYTSLFITIKPGYKAEKQEFNGKPVGMQQQGLPGVE